MDKTNTRPSTKIIVDMDEALKRHNAATGEELNQITFAERYGITTMTHGNYRAGKTPDVLRMLLDIIETTGMRFTELVKRRSDV